tara:strand:- start:30 stop:251 length:222 start_codon:yes stop_codon:yes gene_type:complete
MAAGMVVLVFRCLDSIADMLRELNYIKFLIISKLAIHMSKFEHQEIDQNNIYIRLANIFTNILRYKTNNIIIT